MPDRAMRLPQEFVDAIVAHVDYGRTFENTLLLLRASPTVFAPQICINLHEDYIDLTDDRSYRTLFALSDLSPSIRSNVWHIKIDFRYPTDHLPQENSPDALLRTCSGLRTIHLYSINPSRLSHERRRTVHQAMQLPTLETLRLTSCQPDLQLMRELSALQMSPLLTKMHLVGVRLSGGIIRKILDAHPPTAPGGHAPAFTTFVSDHRSLAFARLLYSSRPYPFGNLRELGITRDMTGPSLDAAQQLIRNNPRLARLSIRCDSLRSLYDLSKNVALRTLAIDLHAVEAWSPTGVAEFLDTIPASGERTLEQFRLNGMNDGARTLEALQGWQAMDTALCRFEVLQTVEMRFGMVWASAGEKLAELPGFLEKMHERGILTITYK